jgi:membrane protease YdiL (CAAX protease family)
MGTNQASAQKWGRRDPVLREGSKRYRRGLRTRARVLATAREPRVPMAPPVVLALVATAALVAEGRWDPIGTFLWDRTSLLNLAIVAPYVVFIAVMAWATLRWGRPRVEGLIPSRQRGIEGVVTVGVAAPLAVAAAAAVAVWFPEPERQQPFEVAPAAMLIAAAVGAPIIEELIFRGWLLGSLSQTRLRGVGAVIVSSLAFGAAHVVSGVYGPIGFASTAMLGAAAGVAVLVTGSLIPAIIAHALNNLAVSLSVLGLVSLSFPIQWTIVGTALMVLSFTYGRGKGTATLAVAVERSDRWAQLVAAVRRHAERLHLAGAPVIDVRSTLGQGLTAVRVPGKQLKVAVANQAVQERPAQQVEIAVARILDDAAHPGRRLRVFQRLAFLTWSATFLCIYLAVIVPATIGGLPAGMSWLLVGLVPLVPASLLARLLLVGELRRRAELADDRLVAVFGADAVADELLSEAGRRSSWRRAMTRIAGPLAGDVASAERATALRTTVNV